MIGRLAKWWAGRSPLATTDGRQTNFAVESLEPRLLLSAVFGSEAVDPVRVDVNPTADLIPVAAIEVSTDTGDCATDTQLDSLQLSLAQDTADETQAGNGGSDSTTVGSQPGESGIETDQLLSTDLSGETSSPYRGSLAASYGDIAYEGASTSDFVDDGACELQTPGEYQPSNLSCSTEQLVDTLHAAEPPPQGGVILSAEATDAWAALGPVLEEAIRQWSSLPMTEELQTRLAQVKIEVADLSRATLAQTLGETILIDTSAAGSGWFIDPTPSANEEFAFDGNLGRWFADSSSAAYGRVDLLTVAVHEIGHVLGLGHDSVLLVMEETLPSGARVLPGNDSLSLVEGAEPVQAALTWTPGTGTSGGILTGEADDGNLTFRVFDFDGNTTLDVQATGSTGEDTIYTDVASVTGLYDDTVVVDMDLAASWNLTGAGSGTATVTGYSPLNFTAIENLVGGDGQDTFAFPAGVAFEGTIDGGGGTNTLDYSAYTTGVTASLTAATATGTAGISNIHNVIGGSGADEITGDGSANILVGNAGDDTLGGGAGGDILAGGTGNDTYYIDPGGTGPIVEYIHEGTDTVMGPDAGANWVISGADTGTAGGVNFANVELLVGGPGDDDFEFESGGLVSGSIEGGTGSNDTITGAPAVDNTWIVTGTNAGTLTFNEHESDFTGVEHLVGRADNIDAFIVEAGGSIASVDGGSGGTDGLLVSGDIVEIEDPDSGGSYGGVSYANLDPQPFVDESDLQNPVITGSTFDDMIRVYADAAGLNIARGSTIYTIGSLQLAALVSLKIEGRGGSDTITIESLPDGFSADLQIYGRRSITGIAKIDLVIDSLLDSLKDLVGDDDVDSVVFAGIISSHGGDVGVLADTITVDPYAVLSTSKTGADSGDIDFGARTITLETGSGLFADAATGLTAGDVTLEAWQSSIVRLTSPRPSATITATRATIKGDWVGMSTYAQDCFGVFGWKKDAVARVTLTDTVIIANAVSMEASADTSLIPPIDPEMTGNPNLTFGHNAIGWGTITRDSGSWLLDGFFTGQAITVYGTENLDGTINNDGYYTVAFATADTITLIWDDTIVDEADVAGAQVIGQLLVPDPETIISEFIPFPTPMLFSLSNAEATVKVLGASSITAATGSVSMSSRAESPASSTFPGVPIPKVAGIAAVWTQSSATAETVIDDTARVTAHGALELDASASNTVTGNAMVQGRNKYASVTFAGGKADTVARAYLGEGTTVTVGDLSVSAEGNTDVETAGAVINTGNSGVSLALTLVLIDTDTDAWIAGTVHASGAVSVSAAAEESNIAQCESRSLGSTGDLFTQLSNQYNQFFRDQLTFITDYGKSVPLFNPLEYVVGKIFPVIKSGKFNLAGAVTFAKVDNDVHAYIAENAHVYAGGAVDLAASMVYRSFTTAVSQSTSDKIAVGGAVAITMDDNDVKAYIGKNAVVDAEGSIDITATFLTPFPWETDFTSPDAVLDFLMTILSGDVIQLILSSYVFNSSTGSKFGLAASVDVRIISNVAEAYIDEGADVDSGAAVTVYARNEVNGLHLTGQMAGWSFLDQLLTNQAANKLGSSAMLGRINDLINDSGIWNKKISVKSLNDPKAGVGGAFSFVDTTNKAIARIADGADVTAATDVNVLADTQERLITVAASYGTSEKLGVYGSGDIVLQNNTARAYIEDKADITAGDDLTVRATNDPRVYSISGGVVKGAQVGIGISVSFNQMTIITKAFIGNGATINGMPGLTFTDVSLTGNPSVRFEHVALTGTDTLVFADNAAAETDTRDTITRSAGSWLADGFQAGQYLTIEGSAANDGTYLIAEVTDLTLTLDAGEALTSETLTRHVMSGSPVLTFADNSATTDTITRDSGSWLTDGFAAGQVIRVEGSGDNDGLYLIAGVTELTLTLVASDSLRPGTVRGARIATVSLTAPDTITRGSGSWLADGFLPGQTITVGGTSANNGAYTIQSVTATCITLVPDESLHDETAGSGASVSAPDTIIRAGGSWLADGFQSGQTVTVSNAGANNGTYTIGYVTDQVLTLIPTDVLTDGTSPTAMVTNDPYAATGVISVADDIDIQAFAGPQIFAFSLAGSVATQREQAPASGDSTAGAPSGATDAAGNTGGFGLGISGDASVNYVNMTTLAYIEGAVSVKAHDVHLVALTSSAPRLANDPAPDFGTVVMTGAGKLTFSDNASSETDTRDTITRDSGSWVTDGFRAGQKITIGGSGLNDGTYIIEEVTASTLTLAQTAVLTNEVLTRHVTSGTPVLTFADNGAAADTITRDSGSWLTDGFAAGQTIYMQGSDGNDGTYTIAGVTDSTLTLSAGDALAAGTASGVSIATPAVTAPNTFGTESPTTEPTLTFRDNGAAADTITRSSGNWLAEGFRAGQSIKVSGTTSNNGTYIIADATPTTLTLTSGATLTYEITNSSDDPSIEAGAALTGNPALTFAALPLAQDTIERSEGSWIADGFRPGMKIEVSGTEWNDGEYTVADVSATTLTLIGILIGDPLIALKDEGPITGVVVTAAGRGKATQIFALAGAVTITTQKGSGAAIAGSFTMNQINARTEAFLAHTDARIGGQLVLGARTPATIYSVGASVAVATDKGKAGLAGQVTYNKIDNESRAYITDTVISGPAASTELPLVALVAEDAAEIVSVAGAVAFGGKAGIGASVAINTVSNTTESFILNSDVTAASVSARADSSTEIIAVTAAVGASSGKMAAAAAVSVNMVSNTTAAFIKSDDDNEHSITVSGPIVLNAVDGSSIYAIAGGVAFAKGKVGIGVSVTYNEIDNETLAYISNMTVTSTAGDSEIRALSKPLIFSIAIAGAVAVSSGDGTTVAVAVGGTLAMNEITDSVLAYVDASDVTTNGDLVVGADSDADIETLGIGVSVSVASGSNAISVSIGVCVSWNIIDSTVEAYLNESDVTSSAGNIALTADSDDTIRSAAVAASLAIAVFSNSGLAISGAGALSSNSISGATKAYIDGGTVIAKDLTLAADNGSRIDTLVLAAAVGAGALGAAVALNTISGEDQDGREAFRVLAYAQDAVLNVGGDLSLTATSTANIGAAVNAAAVGVVAASSDSTSLAASGTGVFTRNEIAMDVLAFIDGRDLDQDGTAGSVTLAGGDLTLESTNASEIKAEAGAASVALAFGSSNSFSLSIGVALAHNRIDDRVEAFLDNLSSVLTNEGNISISAEDESTIRATAVAVAVSVSMGGSNGVALSGGGAEATNIILTTTNAYISDSTVGSSLQKVGKLDLDAKSTATIEATIAAVAASVSYGGTTGVGVALGVAVARNFIGWDITDANGDYETGIGLPQGETLSNAQTRGTLLGTTVKISDGARAGDVYEYLGPTLTQPVETGVSSETRTLTQNEDFIRVAADYAGPGGTSGAIYKYIGASTSMAVDLSQQDYTDTDRWQLVSIDLRTLDYSDRSLWKQVNVDDDHPSEVRAYLENTSVRSSDAVTLDAESGQSITAKVGAGAAALSGGGTTGIAASGAGVYAENRINSVVQAYIDGDGANVATDGISAASVHIAASDASGIHAVAGAASLAASVGGTGGGAVSIGLSIAINEVRNDVAAYIRNADGGVATSSGSITLSAVSQGRHLFDFDLSGLITAANLDDAAQADADNPDDPASSTDNATSRFDDAINEALEDADDDRAILEALRTAFGGTLALYDTVATAAKYWSSDEEQDVREGDTVLLAKDYAGGGLGGRVYRYIVKAPENSGTYGTYGSETYQTPNNLDLSEENYTNTAEWQLVDSLKLSILVEGKSWMLLAPDGRTYVLELNEAGDEISVSHTTISAVSAAASLALGVGGSGGVAVSGAGAVAQNVILTKTNAYSENSVLDSYDDVTISAASTATISSAVVAASLAIGGGGAAGVGVSIGVSIARNFIGWTPDGTETPAQVQAYLKNTTVTAGGDLAVTSLASQRIDSVVFAGSAAVALAGTVGVAASGSGVWAENKIGVDVKSYIDGDGNGGIRADSLTLTADDTSTIKALAGAASLAASVGGTVGVSFSIGVSLARNTITSDVEAYIKNADGVPADTTDFGIIATTTGGIALGATERATIHAISTAASLAAGFAGVAGVAISGAGADANNIILTGTNAYIQDSVVISAGKVDLDAGNTAGIRAVAVSASAAIAVGGIAGVGASLGVAVARNYIGWDPDYEYDEMDYSTGDNPASIVTGNTVRIAAGANAGNVYEYIGTQTLFRPTAVGSSSGQGNADENDNWLTRLNYADNSQWRLVNLNPDAAQVQAYVLSSSVGATGDLTLDAISDQAIDATVFAGSVAISGGLVGVSLSGAGASSENRIATLVQAYIQGDKDGKGITAASISLNADDTSAINAFTGAASIGAAFGGVGVSLSIGVGIAFNEIDNDVAGFIKDVGAGLTSNTGDISITVTEAANIEATAAAASAALALGLVGASLSGAGAVADNVILGSTNAYVDNSVLNSAQDVILDADNTSTINAEVLAVAAAIGGGAFAGAGLSIGVAIARNRIGYSATGVYTPIEVQAYIKNSSVNAAGALTLTATSTQDIDAIIWAGSVAASAGGFAGIGASGAGASATNRVAADVKACVDGSGTLGIIADSISLTAGDTSTIDATVGTAAVAIGVGLLGAGIAISVGVSIASNEVNNQVGAYIANGQNVRTRDGGAITIAATEKATIHALGVAASAALGGGLVGISFAGAGVDVTNVILNKTNAYIEDAVVGTATAKVGNVTITATDTSLIDAEVGGLAVAASGGFVAVGVAVGVALAENLIGYTRDGTAAPAEVQAYIKDSSIHALGDLSLKAEADATIDATVLAGSLALAGGAVAITGAGAGASTRNRVRTLVKAFIDATDPGEDGTGAMGIMADSVALLADDTSSITAFTGSAALAGAVGAVSGSVSISLALAYNEIANEVDAYVLDADLTATGADYAVDGATYHAIDIRAIDAATITATATAASVSATAGWFGSVAVAGGGADAFNAIRTKTRVYVDTSESYTGTSELTADSGSITLEASDTSVIWAEVTTTNAAVSGSGGYTGAIAIGGARARNYIGWGTDSSDPDYDCTTADEPESISKGTKVLIATGPEAGAIYEYIGDDDLEQPEDTEDWLTLVNYADSSLWRQSNLVPLPSEVKAWMKNTAAASGNVAVTASEDATIDALISSTSASVAGGLIAVAAAGAGVSIENRVNTDVAAYVHTCTIDAGSAVTIEAEDSSTIHATAKAVAFAAAIGIGGGVSVSLSSADNQISNQVQAYATSTKITTGAGDLTITATEDATVTSASTASAAAVAGVFAGAVGSATSDATVTTTTLAYADPVELNIRGNIDINALASVEADTTTEGKALSVAFVATSNVTTEATANVMPTVASRLGGYADARKAKADGNISVGSTLAASATALVEGNSLSFSIGKALSAPVATATIAPQAATPASMVSSSISGGNIVSTNGDINVKSISNQDLSAEGTYAVLLGSGAEATSYSRSGSFIATGGATAIATETPYLESWVDSDAVLRAGHAIGVIASSATTPVATAAGQNGGFVGLGESHAYATGSPIVKARMDGTIGSAAGAGAVNLKVRALSVDKAKATSQAVAKGFASEESPSDNESWSTVSPTLDAHIGANSRIYVSGNITVEAKENPEADASTKGVAKGAGGVGGSRSTVNVTPDVTAYIGSGSLIEAGSVNVSAIAKPALQPGQPDYHIEAVGDAEDTLMVSNHNLQTGDVIEYQTDGSVEIGGLDQTYTDAEGETSARLYSVIYVDDNTIALGAAFTFDPEATDIGVNVLNETITFATPHNFLNGDLVVYHASDPNNVMGGLTDGGVYMVRVINANSIQLVAPGASLNSFSVSNVQPDGKTITDPNNFVNGQAVTYVAPAALTFASSQVDADVTLGDKPEVTDSPGANNIVFFEEVIDSDGNSSLIGIDHHFSNGNYVVYIASPGGAGSSGTALGGLTSGNTYRVVNKTEHSLKLAPTVSGTITFYQQYMSGLDWAAHGFAAGQTILIRGDGANNGEYIIASIDSDKLYITGTFGTQTTISGKTVDGKTPIELSPNKADGSVHSLVLAGKAPIHGLVSGQTYYIIKATKSSYQLASTPGGAAITLGTTGLIGSATHWIGPQSVDLQPVASGTHEFRIDLTAVTLPDGTTTTLPGGTLPNGDEITHRIVGEGGVDLAELVAPPGDTVSSANSKGSAGGVYGQSKNESKSNAAATVTAYIASGSLKTTGAISVLAASETNARANTTNSTGGFVGIGKSWATTEQTSTTCAYIAAGTNIVSGGDVTIDAWSNHITTGTATAKAGGAAADVRAFMTSKLSYDTQAYLESGAKIAAAGHVGITSDANVDALIHSFADGRGFGGGGYAETDLDILDGSQSLVTLAEGAIVIARTAALRATTSNMDVYGDAEGYGAGFVGVSNDFAKVDIKAENKVLLESGSNLTGYRGVDLEAVFNNVDTYAYSYGRVTGLFGYVDSDGNNNTTLTSSVVADPREDVTQPRAQVTAGPRVNDATIFDEVDALIPGMRIAIVTGGLAGAVYEYVGVLQTDSDPDVDGNQKFDLSLQAYEDADLWQQVEVTPSVDSEGAGIKVVALTPGMTVRVSSGEVYKYIGGELTDSDSNTEGNQPFDLSLQNYGDSGLWEPVAMLYDHLADNVVGDATAPDALDQLALYVNTTNYNVKIDADAKVKKKALAAGHADHTVNDNQDRTIVWNANVHISSGEGAELVIDKNGVITKANNVSVRTSENAFQTSGQIVSELEIFVNDIGNGGSGQVYFNDAWVDGDTVAISGAGSTWDFSDTLGQVLITNYWNMPLKINNINVVNTTENPLVDLNSREVSLTFALNRAAASTLVQILNEANSNIILNGMINNPTGSTVIHNSLGNITAARGRDVPESGTGRISLVRTAILDIRAPAGGIGSALPRVNVDMIYPGLPATTFGANQGCGAGNALYLSSNPFFTGQLVQYTTDGTPIDGLVDGNYYTVIRSADGSTIQLATPGGEVITLNPSASDTAAVHQLTPAQHVVGVAGGDIYLDLKAVLRDETAVAEFAAIVDSLTAGGSIDLLLQDAEQETGSGNSAGVRVTALQDPTYPPPQDGYYYTRFWEDDVSVPANIGAFGGNAVDLNCIYDFRDLDVQTGNRTVAGLIATTGNIIIEDADGATVSGVPGLTSTTIAVRALTDLRGTGGHIDVNVDNWVDLTETTGDLRVGLVQSRGGDVTLTATDAFIQDALNDLASDVTGVNITLTALRGGIGTYASRLEFNWSDPTAGLLRATVSGVTWFTFRYHGTTGAILDAGGIHLRYVGAPGVVE